MIVEPTGGGDWRCLSVKPLAQTVGIRSPFAFDPSFGPQSPPAVEALYKLFLDTAEFSDDYDSRDFDGQRDAGERRDHDDRYEDWSEAELNEVAHEVVPRAIVATAEVIRYFYGTVDTTAADVAIEVDAVSG